MNWRTLPWPEHEARHRSPETWTLYADVAAVRAGINGAARREQ